jgi:hypothetical protein
VGRPLFAVARFNLLNPGGSPVLDERGKPKKEILPYCFGTLDGRRGWHWRAVPKSRPLYGLDRLAARPGARVIVAEGEKDADGAARRFPELAAVTSSGGAEAASASGWSVVQGCEVVIWSDHDAAGDGYADAVAKLVRAAGGGPVRVMRVPPDWPQGWGLADPLPEGADEAMLRRLLDEAVAAPVAEAPAVPLGFVLNESGLFAAGGDDAEPRRVCGQLVVTAVTHDGNGRSYGRQLSWHGLDGEAHEWAMAHDAAGRRRRRTAGAAAGRGAGHRTRPAGRARCLLRYLGRGPAGGARAGGAPARLARHAGRPRLVLPGTTSGRPARRG